VLLSVLPFVENFSESINTSLLVHTPEQAGREKCKNGNVTFGNGRNVKAYNVNNHRHQPEIAQELKKAGLLADYSITSIFTGCCRIYSTTTIKLNKQITAELINESYNIKYAESKFVH
jgi:N-acetyl-gamma-glutamylphosphate reductase